jgi:acyl-CoA thioester hydrolase
MVDQFVPSDAPMVSSTGHVIPCRVPAPDETLPTGRFERHIDVAPADFDELGHVNNVVYLRWVQDIATAHWQAAATPTQLEQLAWVAHRHEIDYKAPGLPGDEFIASTWVGLAEAVRFERFVEILRAPDRKVLASARTLWVPINRATGRVTRVDDEVRRVFST